MRCLGKILQLQNVCLFYTGVNHKESVRFHDGGSYLMRLDTEQEQRSVYCTNYFSGQLLPFWRGLMGPGKATWEHRIYNDYWMTPGSYTYELSDNWRLSVLWRCSLMCLSLFYCAVVVLQASYSWKQCGVQRSNKLSMCHSFLAFVKSKWMRRTAVQISFKFTMDN